MINEPGKPPRELNPQEIMEILNKNMQEIQQLRNENLQLKQYIQQIQNSSVSMPTEHIMTSDNIINI